jgi:uncharacterized membrane protein
MSLLIAGMCLWAVVHLVPSVAPGLKTAWKEKLGEGGYMGSFALLILAAMVLMVLGWRGTQPSLVYLPDPALRLPSLALMVLAFLLLGATKRPSRIGRIVRHPQLTGVLVWSLAHLLVNGDNRSLVLFGGFATWTVLEIVLISRREGAWVKPEAPGWGAEAIGAAISLVVMAAFVFAHPWIAGMPVR